MSEEAQRGFVPSDLARRYRVSHDKVLGWIRRGELKALNVADARCGRPRFVITPEALAAFEKGRSAAEPPKAPRRRRQPAVIDFYPD